MSLISMHQALFGPDRSVYRYACLKNETKSERVLSCSLSRSLFHIVCGPQLGGFGVPYLGLHFMSPRKSNILFQSHIFDFELRYFGQSIIFLFFFVIDFIVF